MFPWSVYHRDLHSFPTRRSSDLGGLYVSSKFPQNSIGRRLLEEMLLSMRAIPHLTRIEAQLMPFSGPRSEEHTSELQSRQYLVCRLLLEKKKTNTMQQKIDSIVT